MSSLEIYFPQRTEELMTLNKQFRKSNSSLPQASRSREQQYERPFLFQSFKFIRGWTDQAKNFLVSAIENVDIDSKIRRVAFLTLSKTCPNYDLTINENKFSIRNGRVQSFVADGKNYSLNEKMEILDERKKPALLNNSLQKLPFEKEHDDSNDVIFPYLSTYSFKGLYPRIKSNGIFELFQPGG